MKGVPSSMIAHLPLGVLSNSSEKSLGILADTLLSTAVRLSVLLPALHNFGLLPSNGYLLVLVYDHFRTLRYDLTNSNCYAYKGSLQLPFRQD